MLFTVYVSCTYLQLIYVCYIFSRICDILEYLKENRFSKKNIIVSKDFNEIFRKLFIKISAWKINICLISASNNGNLSLLTMRLKKK